MKHTTAKKHRFNIVDFVLIIATLACVIGIAIRYNLHSSLMQGSSTATVTVMIEGLLEDNTDTLFEGDTFYYQKTGNRFGTLLSWETRPAKIRFVNADGTYSTTNYIDRVDVICQLEVEGYNSEDGFMIGGSTYVGCGSDILVRSRNLETQWIVLDIEVHS